MIQVKDKSDCCGCTACASICPKDAITMEPDTFGFKYPKVDLSKCIGCGLCEKVCAFNENYDKSLNLEEPKIYAARHKNMHEIETSRSGAAFIAISDYILENGGIVYGVGYKDHFRVAHKRATTKEERNEFKGSKYVQSDLDGIFRQVKEDLKQGKTVLFSGTPCQTSGLNSFISKKLRMNLILVDILCHGVPGPRLWNDYISYLEKKFNDKIIGVNFRDKQMFGWKAHRETFDFLKGGKMSFKYTFYQNIVFRYSCGKCHFANTKRPSDITIADFWGWEKACPNFNNDNKGVSLVLLNTKKGCNVFKEASYDLRIMPVKLEDCLQPNMIEPTPTNHSLEAFEKSYKKYGFKFIYYRYGNIGLIYRIRQLKKILNKLILI